MTSDLYNDDSNSNSLPDLANLFPAPSNEISKGDIVWAKFKKLCWPALVRHIYKKEKKVTVWYADDPGKNFKLPLRNVFLFHDSQITTKIKKDANEAGVGQAHDGLTSHAVSYLNRKAQGIKDDPLKFFDQTFPYFTVEDWLQKNPNADKDSFMNLKIEPLYINHNSTTFIRKRGCASGPDASDEDSDIEFTEGEAESEEETVSLDNKAQNLKIFFNSDASDKEYADKIVTFISSGEVDNHLVNIRSKNLSSEHQEFYLKAMKSDKRDLDYISYGPVEDLEKLREIIFYLLDLYERVSAKKSNGKKRGAKCELDHFCITKTEEARYVASVWLPESIIFAISKINNISLSEAKKIFHKRKVFKSEKVQNVLETVDLEDDNVSSKSQNSTGAVKRSKCNVEIPLCGTHKDFHYDRNVEGTPNKRDRKAISCKESEGSLSTMLSPSISKKKKKIRKKSKK